MSGPVLLTTLGEGRIIIGSHFGASAAVLSSRASIEIGHHVKLGGNVRIFDHDFHSLNPVIRRTPGDTEQAKAKKVVIGDDVFIGAEAIILKGVELGGRCIVGAGSVVTRSFPADSIIAGNPAQLVKAIVST
jgi:acetyltransferase-like isoleucine patch superfamily enzyme